MGYSQHSNLSPGKIQEENKGESKEEKCEEKSLRKRSGNDVQKIKINNQIKMKEQNDDIPQDVNSISIGEINITSTRNTLSEVMNTAKKLLNDASVKNYLDVTLPKRKMLGL